MIAWYPNDGGSERTDQEMNIRALFDECRITHRRENKNHAAVSFVMSQATNDFFFCGENVLVSQWIAICI